MHQTRDTRQELIEAARTLYASHGMASTTIQQITSSIGVSRSLFYKYFANKDEVTVAVLDAYVDEFVEALKFFCLDGQTRSLDEALGGIVRLFRLCLFENDSFHMLMASRENAQLYLDFVDKTADRVARAMTSGTLRMNKAFRELRVDHPYESMYMLFVGLVAIIRNRPEVDDEVLKDLIVDTLHIQRP